MVSSTYLLIRIERKRQNASKFLERLRIKQLSKRPVLFAVGIWFLALIFQTVFNLIFENYLNFDDTLVEDIALTYANYHIENKIIVYLIPIGLIFVAIAEELFWRGYILPLQELRWGKYAWVINGILWALSHIFVYNFWSMIFMFLALPYIGFKFKNTSITIIMHVLINSLSALHWFNTYSN